MAARRPGADRVCSFEGCGRKHSCNGLCSAHNWQRHIGHELTPILPRRTGCTTPGCDSKHHSMGLCKRCYERARTRNRPRPPSGTCLECDRPARSRGLCDKHYARLRRAAARAGAPIAAPEGARLPKTWEAKTPKPTLPKREFPEIVLAPDDPEAQRRLRIILRRHDADDLTDMLGLTA